MISFLDQDRNTVCKADAGDSGGDLMERALADGEEIIGVYGTVEYGYALDCVGFIVWKPPIFN